MQILPWLDKRSPVGSKFTTVPKAFVFQELILKNTAGPVYVSRELSLSCGFVVMAVLGPGQSHVGLAKNHCSFPQSVTDISRG